MRLFCYAILFLINGSAIGGSEGCKLLLSQENREKHGKIPYLEQHSYQGLTGTRLWQL
jgi:hypothetical protein